MSVIISSSNGVEDCGVDVHEKTEDVRNDASKETEIAREDSSSPDRSVMLRVLKDVGLTSTAFIGPAFPPNTVKSDIEDTLSEFYKEIEKIDRSDSADDNPGKQDSGLVQPVVPPSASVNTDSTDGSKENVIKYAKTHDFPKPKSWQHWYQNEPYYNRRPRPSMDPMHARTNRSQWCDPQIFNRPTLPNPSFHRPPFRCPPPSSAFSNLRNPPPRMNHTWGSSPLTYQEQPPFPAFQNIPPPHPGSHPSQVLYGDSAQYRDEQRDSYDAHAYNANIGLSRDRRKEWHHLDDGYDKHQRYDSKNSQWEYPCQPPDDSEHHSSLVLILMRGLPGSGKSTCARELLFTGPDGLILSTDDYFADTDGYRYNAERLGAAHEWNQNRAEKAMYDGRSPIIIDNTNIQAWEMKPYVRMALQLGYTVDFCEPETSWKFDPYELEKRNKHGVPQQKIAQMMDRFSFPISVDIVMSSQEPLHVNQRRRPEHSQMIRKKQGLQSFTEN